MISEGKQKILITKKYGIKLTGIKSNLIAKN